MPERLADSCKGFDAGDAPERASSLLSPEPTMTLTWGWALYVVVPFLLFVVVLVVVLAIVRRRWG